MRERSWHMNQFMPTRRFITMGAMAALIVLVAPTTHAQTWDGGGGNALFSTGANWAGDAAPPPSPTVNGSTVVFGTGFASGNPVVDNDYTFFRIHLNRPAPLTLATTSSSN